VGFGGASFAHRTREPLSLQRQPGAPTAPPDGRVQTYSADDQLQLQPDFPSGVGSACSHFVGLVQSQRPGQRQTICRSASPEQTSDSLGQQRARSVHGSLVVPRSSGPVQATAPIRRRGRLRDMSDGLLTTG
jgi:hypothetical protein